MIIKDRLICGFKSKNPIPGTKAKRKFYSRRALESKIPEIEGANIYLNHNWDIPKGRRNFQDLIGRTINVHIGENGLRGDYELSDLHPEALRIKDHFDKNLPLGGMSPDFTGIKYATIEGEQVVMEIGDVNSLDFVAEPATGRITESDDTPLTPEDQNVIEIQYVPKIDYDKLLERVSILESRTIQSEAPAYVPQPAPFPNQTQINISDLIRNVRN